ncbi:MAG: IPTL-CTERM sorting domain-containing protein [Candidatus Competibacteraceae bacterium]|nr:IPTL-CTERM sorting domain-containing protein [Candidatus Competibacteraceae bacterium]
MTPPAAIPTLSEWDMILLTMLLGLALGRRKVSGQGE